MLKTFKKNMLGVPFLKKFKYMQFNQMIQQQNNLKQNVTSSKFPSSHELEVF